MESCFNVPTIPSHPSGPHLLKLGMVYDVDRDAVLHEASIEIQHYRGLLFL